MNKKDKQQLLEFLSEQLKLSKISVLAEFSGLSVKETEEFRREMKKHSSRVLVVKNTLMKMALQARSLDEATKFMEGPNLLIWTDKGDEAEVVKEILKFSKSSGKLKIKFGLLNNAFLPVEQIEKLGSLPSKKTLQAMVIGGIKAPLSNIVYNVKYPIIRMIMILRTFSDKKEKENG
ncbi:MAG: 50S ribosomal protein L10 [Candidatus Omnitrophica bacterium]|nr:50S ribosomal protein L10 [Candidatus Omnitrophota bacterium]MCM8816259.1 50S ribosomal protein L10 [Candidatus Omnitrophota bacterium]